MVLRIDQHFHVPGGLPRHPETNAEKVFEPVEVGEIKNAPACHRNEKEVKMREYFRDGLQHLPEEQSLDADQHPEVKSPEDKIPACTVPHSRKEPNDEEVEQRALPVASKRYVNVIAEESAERDMPSPPEIGGGGCGVRVIKILMVVKPEHPAQTYG